MSMPERADESAGTMTLDADEGGGPAVLAADSACPLPPGLPLRYLAESRCVCLFVLDADLAIRACNPAAEALSGYSAARLAGKPIAGLLREDSAATLAAADVGDELGQPFVLRFVDADGAPYTRVCRLQLWRGGVYLVGEPLVDRERALADALMDLHVRGRLRAAGGLWDDEDTAGGAHWRIRKLQEHLPICAVCHRVHEAGSPWETLSGYLQRNGLRMTHGYCPDCEEAALAGLNRMYPEKKGRK
jgi:PAS domain-containing protein